MTEQEAVVTRIEGRFAWLDIDGAGDCASCSQRHGCGERAKRKQQRVVNTAGVRVGQRVIVGVPEGAVLRATLWSYLLPLAVALLGAASGLTLAGDAGAAFGTLMGLLGGWGALRLIDRRMRPDGEPMVALRIKDVVVQLHGNALK